MKTYGRSHRGLVRTHNEDNFLIRPVTPDGCLLAVADGIGGGPGGREASRLALAVLDDAIGVEMADVARLAAAVTLVNRRVHDAGLAEESLYGMGTTLTAAVMGLDRLLLAHVGDSRAYRLGPSTIERLTEDHSVASEMERAGSLTHDEALHHPRRHVLTRAIGPFDRVRVDLVDRAWSQDDQLLLCTDGLSAVLTDEDIFRLYRLYGGQQLVERLVDLALDRGGPDNVTVVLAEVERDAGDGYGR